MDLSSSLLTLFKSSATGTSNSGLLSALYGGSNGTTASASTALQNLSNAEANQTKEVAATAKEPQVARDLAAFRTAVAHATSVDQLLSNQTVLRVLLTANGLGDYTSYTALAKKALTSNPGNKSGLANTLSNQQWKTTNKTLDFFDKGLANIQSAAVLDTISNSYAEATWRKSLDTTTPGLSHALTFRAEAKTITSAEQILGDATMRDVVTTALGIPAQIAFQTDAAQQKAIKDRVDVTKFQDPKFVDSFVQKYLIAKANTATSTATASLDSLAVQASGLVV